MPPGIAASLLVALAAIASSCAPAAPSQTAAGPRRAPTWSTSSWEDRHITMTFAVLPNMGRTWKAFEKTAYPELTCTRCHGADAEAVSYRMPSRSLPPLDPKRLPRRDAADPKEARMARFMFDEVVPQMTELLDAEPYDPKTGRGFFCFDCHPQVQP